VADDAKRCHQCGRVGTRQFEPYPDHSFDFGPIHGYPGRVRTVTVGEWGWECANGNACRKRWPKIRDYDYESGA
jgi:hypothetical protein